MLKSLKVVTVYPPGAVFDPTKTTNTAAYAAVADMTSNGFSNVLAIKTPKANTHTDDVQSAVTLVSLSTISSMGPTMKAHPRPAMASLTLNALN